FRYRGGFFRQDLWANPGLELPAETAQPGSGNGCGNRHLNDSIRLWITVLKSPSFCRRSSTLRIEWITVEWCLPPKLLPISGSAAFVSALHRYIAICRGSATDFELFFDFSSATFSE